MAASWATVTYTPNQLSLCSAVDPSRWSRDFLKVYSPRRGIFGFFLAQKHSRVRTFVVESNQVSSLQQTHQGIWEDPDDGGDSEYEDEEEEENNLDFESDWEDEENNALATVIVQKAQKDEYEENLVKGYSPRNTNWIDFIS